jgi:UDP-N-acetylglucosamine:LPS N-acetylglucosamine transferase
MAALVARADLAVTKAGSVTIAELAAARRPMIVAAALPGQEDGNPALVALYGAGLVARGSREAVGALRLLRAEPARLAALAAGCRRLARPAAAQDVAQALLERLSQAGGTLPRRS